MSNVLDRNLYRVLDTIESCLREKVVHAVNTQEEKFLKQMGLTKKFEKIAELKTKGQEIEHSIQTLENEIEKEKKRFFDPIPREFLDLGCPFHKPHKVTVDSYAKVSKLPAGKNFLAFKKIESTVRAMYDLAINSKEKREIILSLQNQNWRELGINLPPINSLESLNIENGAISLKSFECLPSVDG